MKQTTMMLGLLIGCILVALVWGCRQNPSAVLGFHLCVQHLDIQGCQRIPREVIAHAAAVPIDTPLFSLDLKQVAARVQSLKWVRSCEARRIFPNTLALRIIERRPVALVHIDQMYYVDEDGTPFVAPGPGDSLDFPVFTGWENISPSTSTSAGKCAELVRLLTSLHQSTRLSREGISEIHTDEMGNITVVSATRGLTISLGQGDIDVKIRRLEDVMQKITARNLPAQYIVCQSSNRLVVGLRERR